MKQRHNDNFIAVFANTFRPIDDHGIIMHAADKTEWFIKCCLKRAGLSGYLGPGVSTYSLK